MAQGRISKKYYMKLTHMVCVYEVLDKAGKMQTKAKYKHIELS
jgi:hypothetical protein